MSQAANSTIILGGGFMGLFTALHLNKKDYDRSITLVDREDKFSFNPMMYEYLSGEMSGEQVYPRYLDLLEGSRVRFERDTVSEINPSEKSVDLASGLNYTYDNLVLTLGSVGSFFGIEGAKEHTFLFRTGEQATELGRYLRECLQKATQTKDEEQRRQLLTCSYCRCGCFWSRVGSNPRRSITSVVSGIRGRW